MGWNKVPEYYKKTVDVAVDLPTKHVAGNLVRAIEMVGYLPVGVAKYIGKVFVDTVSLPFVGVPRFGLNSLKVINAALKDVLTLKLTLPNVRAKGKEMLSQTIDSIPVVNDVFKIMKTTRDKISKTMGPTGDWAKV